MRFLISIVLLSICSQALSATPIFTDSQENAERISKDLDMPILTIVSADWCSPCKKIKKEITENPNLLNDIIVLQLDFDKNKQYIKVNNITKIPVLIFKKKKYTGYSEAWGLISKIQSIK